MGVQQVVDWTSVVTGLRHLFKLVKIHLCACRLVYFYIYSIKPGSTLLYSNAKYDVEEHFDALGGRQKYTKSKGYTTTTVQQGKGAGQAGRLFLR